MHISVVDRGAGIVQQFAQALGATARGRFIDIPTALGGGYLTGFGWGRELRMMVRHYYLREAVRLERTEELTDGPDEVVFLLRGIFPPLAQQPPHVRSEPASVFIVPHAASAVLAMPADTLFNSVTIAVARPYLRQLFGQLAHPVAASVLAATGSFALETGISPALLATASDLLHPPVPEDLASAYCKLKCEELLCHTFALLLQREATPVGHLPLPDLKALYALKHRLQALPLHGEAPHLAALAREAGMSEPKLRRLFKQTFGQSLFDYFQTLRMQEAARLLQAHSLTVAEVGHQLGFTNLSHFARVFAQHTGLTPKKYATQAAASAG